jgi:hypothetical protein
MAGARLYTCRPYNSSVRPLEPTPEHHVFAPHHCAAALVWRLLAVKKNGPGQGAILV